MQKTLRQSKGKMGEIWAEQWMRRKGYRILYKNWQMGKSEIDLVCSDGKQLVFVEVRCHFSATKTFPESSIWLLKQTSMQKATQKYLSLNKVELPVRQDVVGIRFTSWGKQLLHIPDAINLRSSKTVTHSSKLYH